MRQQNVTEVVRKGPKADHTVVLSVPSPLEEADTRPRSTKCCLSPRLSYAAPSLPTHVPLPNNLAEGHCVLARGSSWGHCTGRPLDPGDEEGGAELTVWHCTWHQAKAPPWETHPTPFSTSVLLFTNESFCFFPFLSPFLNLPSDTAQTCCYPSTASTVPSGSQGASPYLVSSCLWLKQGGQPPLDPKGAPISRDVSKPWVQLGQ